MTDTQSDQPLVHWLNELAGPAKTQCFSGAHIASCPTNLAADAYLRWGQDAAFTAKMAQEYADGDEDYNRAEFWDAVCRFLMRKAGRPVDAVRDPLPEDEYDKYLRTVAANLSGEEQTAMRQRSPAEYDAWFELQMTHVPMPGFQKPDINGFREGDVVMLTKPFQGETRHYDRFRTGTVFISNTSPSQIRLGRQLDPHDLLMDDGGLIGLDGLDITKIGRRMSVVYSADGDSVGVANFGGLKV